MSNLFTYSKLFQRYYLSNHTTFSLFTGLVDKKDKGLFFKPGEGRFSCFNSKELKAYMASLEPKDLSTKDKELWDAHVLALMTAYAKYAIRVMELASYERFKEGLLNHATDDDCRALLPK